MLRADLRICRAHGWTWGYWIDDLDDLERDLWRALESYEADLCPGCGQPRSESLWVKDQHKHKGDGYGAGYTECRSCYALGEQQEAQRVKDAEVLERLTANNKKPHLVKRPVTAPPPWEV